MGKSPRKKHKKQMNNIAIRIEDIWAQKFKEYFFFLLQKDIISIKYRKNFFQLVLLKYALLA